jgi:hypothetical protein
VERKRSRASLKAHFVARAEPVECNVIAAAAVIRACGNQLVAGEQRPRAWWDGDGVLCMGKGCAE